jgi:hypothetical protein
MGQNLYSLKINCTYYKECLLSRCSLSGSIVALVQALVSPVLQALVSPYNIENQKIIQIFSLMQEDFNIRKLWNINRFSLYSKTLKKCIPLT